jgi:hypothetical protein
VILLFKEWQWSCNEDNGMEGQFYVLLAQGSNCIWN